MKFMRRQCTRFKPCTEMVQHAVEHERKRLQKNNRKLKFLSFFKYQRQIRWNQRAVMDATRFPLEFETPLPQPFSKCNIGQGSEITKFADTPTAEGFQQFFGGVRIRFISK